MQATRRRDTRPELRLRRRLHALGLRFLVDAPVPGTSCRRRADVLLRGARTAVYVDGCFWHSCPDHLHLPRANREWWIRKLESIVARDRDTDASVRAAGWWPVRVWEHEDPVAAAARVARIAQARTGFPR
ncbi:very short patch repair endonuclease [Pseudonocardia broussonetiae]|uniref:Very short patch repair endonuclease n=2 Tax=Pseudonocardia broussonetiae TaxID=2736640 RepID=A0A6M6JSD6_9PSEU|nr:very short patch repair endonuclease [Pseudonocardia broussonetiae]